jgi:hypothetical protein
MRAKVLLDTIGTVTDTQLRDLHEFAFECATDTEITLIRTTDGVARLIILTDEKWAVPHMGMVPALRAILYWVARQGLTIRGASVTI